MNSNHPNKTVNFVLARIDFQQQLVRSCHWQCCMNCTHFDEQREGGYCDSHKAKPPAYILMHGCERYLSDVPF